MRIYVLLMAGMLLATAAYAQTAQGPAQTPSPLPTILPAEPTPDQPAYREDTVILDKKVNSKGPIYRRSSDPYGDLPPATAEMLRQADQAKKKGTQQFYRKTSEPMLSPDGKELVGMVGNRYLTMDQLKKRVDLLMKTMPTPDKSLQKTGIVIETPDNAGDDKQREEDRRILLEGRVLDDWARVATLAVCAEEASSQIPAIKVSEAEIQEALRRLASEAQVDATKIPVAMQSVMFSERELHQEIRDSLLVEKFMSQYVQHTIRPEQMLKLFKENPSAFVDPAKAHTWELFVPREGYATESQAKQAKGLIGDWRGSLNRCKDIEGFKALGEKIKKENGIILSDMGWVLSTDLLDPIVKKAIFTLDQGKTSKVIQSSHGYHVFKVIERKQGEKPTFEAAKPHIVNYLTDKLRDGVYDQAKGKYGLRMAAGGLKKWTVIGPADDAAARIAQQAATTSSATASSAPITASTEPNLGLLRRPTTNGTARRSLAHVPSVEQVIGQPPAKAGGAWQKNSIDSINTLPPAQTKPRLAPLNAISTPAN